MSVISNYSIQGPPGPQGQTGATGLTGATGAAGPIGPSSITGDGTVIVSGSSVAGYNLSAVQQLTTTSNPIFNQVTVSYPQTSSQVAAKGYVDTGLNSKVSNVIAGNNISIAGTMPDLIVSTIAQPIFNQVQISETPAGPSYAASQYYVDGSIATLSNSVVKTITAGTNVIP